MSILVTGAAGFIGSNLVDALLKREETVIGIDNLDDYYSPERKKKNLEQAMEASSFIYKTIDFNDKESLISLIQDNAIDKIIHLGAKAGVRPSIEDPQGYVKANVMGTVNILEAARETGVKKIIIASSSSVYGNNEKTPFSEEDVVDYPISPYAASKKSVELFSHVYHHLYGMDVCCLRFFTVYGPRGRPDMAIYKFTKLIDEGKPITMFGDGSSRRDYTYVSDVVAGVLSALERQLGFEVINLGNSETVELSRLISLIETNLGKKANIERKDMQPGDVDKTFADISKAKRLLDYSPEVSIDEGIKRFISWYRKD